MHPRYDMVYIEAKVERAYAELRLDALDDGSLRVHLGPWYFRKEPDLPPAAWNRDEPENETLIDSIRAILKRDLDLLYTGTTVTDPDDPVDGYARFIAPGSRLPVLAFIMDTYQRDNEDEERRSEIDTGEADDEDPDYDWYNSFAAANAVIRLAQVGLVKEFFDGEKEILDAVIEANRRVPPARRAPTRSRAYPVPTYPVPTYTTSTTTNTQWYAFDGDTSGSERRF